MSEHQTQRQTESRISGRGNVLTIFSSYSMLIAGAVLLMVPFFWLITSSLKTDQEISNLQQLLPENAKFGNYVDSLVYMGLELPTWADNMLGRPEPDMALGEVDPRPLILPRFPALANTIVVTVLVLLVQVASSAVAGYGFARYRFRGREPVFMVMLATMMLPYQITMIPVFLLFRQLGWIDSLLPLIVPFMFGNPFFIFMFRQFFLQIPGDLVEAAKIDGASAFRTFAQIMLPLTKPVIAICAIYSFMFTWNDFLAPLIYLNSPSMRTLAIELNAFNGQYGVEQRNLLLAASLITMLPCVLLFFSAQKHFIDSDASGGLKG